MTAIPAGLTHKEVQERLTRDGYNELPGQKNQSALSIFLSVISEPMLLMLLAAGGLYLALGEFRDAAMLSTFVVVIITITFIQERKTERTLEKLRDLSSPRAYVIRESQRLRIPGREVVVDDVILLAEGDRVPADAVIIETSNLFADESLLTGESIPVAKVEWDGKMSPTQPGGDGLPFVYSGSMIVSGRAVARVTAIGVNTEIGHIGRALEGVVEEETLLKKETAKIVQIISILAFIAVGIVVGIYGIINGAWMEGLFSGLTLSMSLIPEEFPVVLLIFLTLGAWRLSKRNVLTRRSSAIETLGAATVLCVDKTGTITQNIMHLTSLSCGPAIYNLDSYKHKTIPDDVHKVLEYSILASQKDPFDPIEKELKRAGSTILKGTKHIHTSWRLAREYPLSKTLLSLSHVWHSPDKKDSIVAAKGAPEAIADLCHLSPRKKDALMAQVTMLTNRGQRVLGVASATFTKSTLPKSQHDFAFKMVGLIGFADPVRPSISQSVKEAYAAGIRVIMITGDYPGTAAHIASEIGLTNPDAFITGPQLSNMTPGDLRKRIREVNVFARVVPEQKLLLVEALKENGEIVAMTGDGVNDAPALKSAHIGIAMGERGTDVAREASALVLLDDDFSSIVAAVRLGRTIYDNLKKAMAFVVSVHIPIAGMAIMPIALGFPAVLLPAHIAFLELIIDPACTTVFEAEPEDDDVMKRPPRDLTKRLFDRSTLLFSLIQGVSVLVVVFGVYIAVRMFSHDAANARSVAFASLVVLDLMLILSNVSWSKGLVKILITPNRALWQVFGGAVSALILINYIPFLRSLFHLTQMHATDFLIILIAGVTMVVWFELLKLAKKRYFS
jgi:P-type Ca2+ transporter type 2C